MKKLATGMLNIVNALLTIPVALSPFIIGVVADGDPIQNTIPVTSFVFFYGVWTALWISTRYSPLDENEEHRRKILMRYFPIWSIPTYLIIYWIAFTIRK